MYNILICDDEKDIVNALKIYLNDSNYHFLEAFDGEEAMQKKWKAFCRKIDTKTDNYGTVLKTISDFLAKPFSAAISSNNFSAKWHIDVCLWK